MVFLPPNWVPPMVGKFSSTARSAPSLSSSPHLAIQLADLTIRVTRHRLPPRFHELERVPWCTTRAVEEPIHLRSFWPYLYWTGAEAAHWMAGECFEEGPRMGGQPGHRVG